MIKIGSISINGNENENVKGFEANGLGVVFILHNGDRMNHKCLNNIELNYIMNDLEKAYEIIMMDKNCTFNWKTYGFTGAMLS